MNAMTTPTPEMKPLKPCPVLGITHYEPRVVAACVDCPNRAPSPVEVELRELVNSVASIGHIYADDTEDKPSVIYGHPSTEEWVKLFTMAVKIKRKLAKLDASEKKEAGK